MIMWIRSWKTFYFQNETHSWRDVRKVDRKQAIKAWNYWLSCVTSMYKGNTTRHIINVWIVKLVPLTAERRRNNIGSRMPYAETRVKKKVKAGMTAKRAEKERGKRILIARSGVSFCLDGCVINFPSFMNLVLLF